MRRGIIALLLAILVSGCASVIASESTISDASLREQKQIPPDKVLQIYNKYSENKISDYGLLKTVLSQSYVSCPGPIVMLPIKIEDIDLIAADSDLFKDFWIGSTRINCPPSFRVFGSNLQICGPRIACGGILMTRVARYREISSQAIIDIATMYNALGANIRTIRMYNGYGPGIR
jgi:hypothetical protein